MLVEIEIRNWPEDFQQWLLDSFEAYQVPLGDAVTVEQEYDTGPLLGMLHEETENWNKDDYLKAEEFAIAMLRGDLFPPLVVLGPYLLDGYHRLHALQLNGETRFDVIDIRCQPRCAIFSQGES